MITLRRDDSDPEKPKLIIDIDNGDLEALTGVVEKWRFKDEGSLLRFMLAVMSRSTDNTIYLNDELGASGGKHSAYAPADILLKPSEETDANGKSTK